MGRIAPTETVEKPSPIRQSGLDPTGPDNPPSHSADRPLSLNSGSGSEGVWVELEAHEDPRQWTFAKRAIVTTWASALLFFSTLASSAPSGASEKIMAQLGASRIESVLVVSMFLFGYVGGPFLYAPLSEVYGRRPAFVWGTILYTIWLGACAGCNSIPSLLVCRFFAGFFASSPQTNSGAAIADIWPPKSRGIPMALYSLSPFAGPSLGPLLGGFIADSHLDWRWTFIVLTFLGIFASVVTLFLPETYKPALEYAKAQRLRRQGHKNVKSVLDAHRDSWRQEIGRWFLRPAEMLVLEPVLLAMTVYLAFAYTFLYIAIQAYPIIFEQKHGLNPGLAGCAFLSILIGCAFSVPVSVYFNRQYLRDIDRNGGVALPEFRLPMGNIGGVCLCVSIFWLGWTGYRSDINLFAPMASGIFTGLGTSLIFRGFQTYLIDFYEKNAASAVAAVVIIRSLLAGCIPLVAHPMFSTLGVNWACTLLGCIVLLLIPLPLVFAKYGPFLRSKSRFVPH